MIFTVVVLNRFSQTSSQRELLLKKVFSVDGIPASGEWPWGNQKWTFYKESKSFVFKNTLWFILKSENNETPTNYYSYSLIQFQKGEVLFKEMPFLNFDKNFTPKFELRKISSEVEGLFLVREDCQLDFCKEILSVYSVANNQLLEIGRILLSDSNLSNCKLQNTQCFEFKGTYQLEKHPGSTFQNIRVMFKGFEENQKKETQKIADEVYTFENGKFVSESFKKYH